jgi:elongation factor Ts
MSEITAAVVMKLRQMSGQGMMDCKIALQESNGDVEKALDILKKKGLTTLAKRAERETSQGLVVGSSNKDKSKSALAMLCCETDFVAKSDAFVAASKKLSEYAQLCPETEGVDNILKTSVNGKTFNDILTETVSKIGEKMKVGNYIRYELNCPGLISTYIHFNDKVGTMVQIDTDTPATAESDIIKQTANDIAMHITATKPLALDKDNVDPVTVEREKAIYVDQVKNKPANMIDKIVEGKLKKFFAENCLLDQAFVKDDTKTVQQVLAESAKAANGKAKITRFVRFELG